MKRLIILSFISLFLINPKEAKSQVKSRFPIWTFHEKDVNIYGLSLGAFTTLHSKLNTNTYGIRVEAPGFGFLFILFPANFNLNQKVISERVYGINFSPTGSFGSNLVFGINLNGIIGYTYETIGISTSLLANLTGTINGLQISLIGNHAYIVNGLQIGLIGNTSEITNGLQIGMFNNGGRMSGLQLGIVNLGKSSTYQTSLRRQQSENSNGLQFGLVNIGGKMNGLQLGLVNISKSSTFQIGLWNKNEKRQLPLMNF
jgi:hypothetical protein